MIQAAILLDAAAELGRIEWQMAGSPSDAWVIHQRLAAVDVLEVTIRLLRAERAALLEHLSDVVPVTDDPQRECRGPAIERRPRIAPASGA
jgi:hypothetical protein